MSSAGDRWQEIVLPIVKCFLCHQHFPFTPKSWEGPGSSGCQHLQALARKEASSKTLLNISAEIWVLFTSVSRQNMFRSIRASGRLVLQCFTSRLSKVKNDDVL